MSFKTEDAEPKLKLIFKPLVFALLIVSSWVASPVWADSRTLVELPDRMREHMLSNMRDHLLALQQITHNLAIGQYDQAADLAENRLGMSSLQSHGAEHMAKFMPKSMGNIGTRMHQAASRFAVTARNAEIEGGLSQAFEALSKVMQHCAECHQAYRVH